MPAGAAAEVVAAAAVTFALAPAVRSFDSVSDGVHSPLTNTYNREDELS